MEIEYRIYDSSSAPQPKGPVRLTVPDDATDAQIAAILADTCGGQVEKVMAPSDPDSFLMAYRGWRVFA